MNTEQKKKNTQHTAAEILNDNHVTYSVTLLCR